MSSEQKLSEDFIREFQDKVDWNKVSMYQKLSDDFIIEFQDRLYSEKQMNSFRIKNNVKKG